MPGVSMPGIIAAICFALFFAGHYLAGLAGWEVVALFVLGVVFVVVEILFFAHSTIVFGVVGVFLILASLLWAMIDRYPGETFFPTGDMLAIPLRNLFITLVAAIAMIIVLARYLPENESLPPFRADDDESARAVARWDPARICHRARRRARDAGHRPNDAAPQRQGPFRRSRGRRRDGWRIHCGGHANHRHPEGRNARQ